MTVLVFPLLIRFPSAICLFFFLHCYYCRGKICKKNTKATSNKYITLKNVKMTPLRLESVAKTEMELVKTKRTTQTETASTNARCR
jgi:hypothetical protein